MTAICNRQNIYYNGLLGRIDRYAHDQDVGYIDEHFLLFDNPIFPPSIEVEKDKRQAVHRWVWSYVCTVHREHDFDMDVIRVIVEIQFIDGTKETVESTGNPYAYNYSESLNMFTIPQSSGYLTMYPREFVKSIRVLDT